MTNTPFTDWLAPMPMIAILRGIEPGEVLGIAQVLVDAGFRIIEVPLNSPRPLLSIEKLSHRFGGHVLTGAGTVLKPESVRDIEAAGGRLVVMPHANAAVVQAARAQGLYALPGFATPTEAFHMLDAGADALKLFPAEVSPPKVLKAIRAVLPHETAIIPVGGITPDNLGDYWSAGAQAFGLGSALYKAGMSAEQVSENAHRFAKSIGALLPA